jgi:hypothetical protein
MQRLLQSYCGVINSGAQTDGFDCCVQVLLRPDGGGGVRLPARLLALYSCLFDDMFQDMLQQQEEDDAGSNAEPQVVSRTSQIV